MAEEVDDDEVGGEPPFACALPSNLRQDWPVPRRAVMGSRGGVLAWLEYAAARSILFLLALPPHWVRGSLVGLLARLARVLDRKRSESARVFLRQACGSTMSHRELESRVLQAWRYFFHVTLDAEALFRHVAVERIGERFEVEMCPDAQRILDSRTGSILATAHVGDWETGGAMLAWMGFDPFYGVAKPPRNRPLSIHLQRLRERRGMRTLPRRGAMKDAPAVVRAGGMLALILDQRARRKPVYASFFGRRARCDRSAAVLLKRLHAPIVFAACYRKATPWRWRVSIPEVLWPEELEGKSVEEITELVNRGLERLILAAPEQYFWLHDRYRGA